MKKDDGNSSNIPMSKGEETPSKKEEGVAKPNLEVVGLIEMDEFLGETILKDMGDSNFFRKK